MCIRDRASGFSTNTSLPAWQAWMTGRACQWSGVATMTASRSLRSSSLRKSWNWAGLCPCAFSTAAAAESRCFLARAHTAAAAVEKAQGHKPAQFHDFRKLLERKDLDAVMVATPDHWHALPAIHACQAGKDVFVEKPLAYSIG